MSTHIPDKSVIIKFPYHKLIASGNKVTIIKNKAILNSYAFVLLAALIVIYILFHLLPQAPSKPSKIVSFEELVTDPGKVFIVLFAICFVIITVHLSYKRLRRVISNFIIEKSDVITINGEILANPELNEVASVVIQDVGATGGVGGSSTVGIALGNKFRPLCYNLDDNDAKKASTFLSLHLDLPVERREAAGFPLFKLH